MPEILRLLSRIDPQQFALLCGIRIARLGGLLLSGRRDRAGCVGRLAMRPNNGAIKLVAGNSNPAPADAIAASVATQFTKGVVRGLADMEIFVEIQENVGGTDVLVLQWT